VAKRSPYAATIGKLGQPDATGLALLKIVPITSSVGRVLPGETKTVKVKGKGNPFLPDRVFVASAGTAEGAADWNINDIRVNGKSQIVGPGPVRGDAFSTRISDPEYRCPRVKFDEVVAVGSEIEMDVTYVGTTEQGIPFYGAILGIAAQR
jgi:hypothetical protein